MTEKYKPPLAVHFIWHPSNQGFVDPILDSVRSCFARDVDRPFSRGLNIPLFFYSSESANESPLDSPEAQAEKDIVFVFTSVNTFGRDSWKYYIDKLQPSDSFRVLPVAIDKEGLSHSANGSLKNINFLRAYEWNDDLRIQRAMVAMAHEIYRYGFVEISEEDRGKSSSIKIFLSHAKAGDTGRLHAKSIKSYIDNTNMSSFFDATEIPPGFKFDEEITKHIEDSTLVAIESDAYSSRYWCQREILCAKQKNRPIIAVNCLEDCEDRVFPPAANIPCIHVSPESTISDKDILRILIATILETIRYYHALKSLEYYQAQGWIEKNCICIPRPPELQKIIEVKEKGKDKVCYPEPPLYTDETYWLSSFGVDAFTPLWSSSEDRSLKGLRVGISISESPSEGYTKHHLSPDHLKRLAQDIARHLLARSATILYGGDLRKDGFTQFILDEAIVLKNRLNTDDIHVENHLAWPLYVADAEVTAWRAKYNSVMKSAEHDIPIGIKALVDKDNFLNPDNAKNKYIWSRCLTEMRNESIKTSDSRICAGGRLSEYKGKMPGVLEEIHIAMIKNKPIYLLGAFGGVVGEVCETILSGSIAESLTESWQVFHNAGYRDLQDTAKVEKQQADYESIKIQLETVDIEDMAKNAGLCKDEYLRLMRSPFVDECVYLVLKGLKNLAIN